MTYPSKNETKLTEALLNLHNTVQSLRAPNGCPWDREQTHLSLAPYAIEEVYELVEALELAEDTLIQEELGDVLFQVILHAQLASETDRFDLADIMESLSQKMIRRHPHVFAKQQVTDSQEVIQNWERIKAQEKLGKKSSDPFAFPEKLPALQTAHKIGVKAQRLDFDWTSVQEVLGKLKEEIEELEEAIELADRNDTTDSPAVRADLQAQVQEEMGDLLFAAAQVARHLGIEPEQALRQGNSKFKNRFQKMLSKVGDLESFLKLTRTQKESLWQEVKRKP